MGPPFNTFCSRGRPAGQTNTWEVHQDRGYGAEKAPTVGIFLQDICVHNGGLQLFAKSHNFNGTLPHERGTHPGQIHVVQDAMPDIEPKVVCGPAGSIVIFHGDMLHSSTPSSIADPQSEDWRKIFFFDMKPCKGDGRGNETDDRGHNAAVLQGEADLQEEELVGIPVTW